MISIVKEEQFANCITHSGTMHADEVFSTAFLDMYLGDVKVYRTNYINHDKVQENTLIYDVGRGKYDHHQPDAEKRENDITYCSFGLIWREFGKDFLKKYDSDYIDEVWSGIDKDLVGRAILSVDKLAKIGEEEVIKELEEYGIDRVCSSKLFNYFKCDINSLDSLDITNEIFLEGKEEIKELFNYIVKLGLEGCRFTPYLARGLEIYTGSVWEVFDNTKTITSALGGGGRYDKIITNFIDDGNKYPAVGISFGLVPICELLKEDNIDNICDLLIIPLNTNIDSLILANSLREKGIKVNIEMTGRKLKKVLESASKNNIPYVIVLGENEVNTGTIEIKDMESGTKEEFNIKDISKIYDYIKR